MAKISMNFPVPISFPADALYATDFLKELHIFLDYAPRCAKFFT